MTKKRTPSSRGESPADLIDARIEELGDWRGAVLGRIRGLIKEADPGVVEEWKWRGVPVWSHDGIICTGETYERIVKMTFAKGASLEDPKGLFNASLDGNTRRAIDLVEGDRIDGKALQALVRAAVALNVAAAQRRPGRRPRKSGATGPRKAVKLLAGGNPQIAKAEGDEAVQAYIAAMPGWKREIGQWLDALIVEMVPSVRKAVKWNSPFYGIEDQGWFLSVHCYTKYVKVAFFRGTSLSPVSPGESKHGEVRYLDVREDDPRDDTRMAKWIRQAAALPGWVP